MITIESLPADVVSYRIIHYISYTSVLRCVNKFFERCASIFRISNGILQIVKEDNTNLLEYMSKRIKIDSPILFALVKSEKMVQLLHDSGCKISTSVHKKAIKSMT